MGNWRLNQLLNLYKDDPKDEFVLFALAQEYQKMGETSTAINFFLNLKTQNPNYVGLYYHLAKIYVSLDEVAKATKIYSEGMDVAQRIGDLHALGELKNAKLNFELEL